MIFQNFGYNQNYPLTAGASGPYTIEYLIVAGGGGGGTFGGGGAGAGGLQSGSLSVTPTTSYTITVG